MFASQRVLHRFHYSGTYLTNRLESVLQKNHFQLAQSYTPVYGLCSRLTREQRQDTTFATPLTNQP